MTITLDNIRLHAFHGCLPQERRVGNDYRVSLSLQLADDARALDDDNLSGTIDYAEAYAVVREEMGHRSHLLENVAQRILKHLLRRFALLQSASVTITKIAPPIPGATLDGASVSLSRARRQA